MTDGEFHEEVPVGTLDLLGIGGNGHSWRDVVALIRASGAGGVHYRTPKQGRGLTIRELSATYSDSTNNSLAKLTNLVAKLGPPPAEATNLHLVQFFGPNPARVAWRLSQPPWVTKAGTTNNSWEDLNRRLANAAPLLAQLNQILERPDPNDGRQTNPCVSRIAWRETQMAATWLTCMTLAKLHDGRRDDALAGIRAMAGLANLYHEEFTLAQQMTRVAVGNMGMELTWEALQSRDWTEQQLAALQQCWEEIDFIQAVQRGFEGEREMPLVTLDMIRSGKIPSLQFTSDKKTAAPGKSIVASKLYLSTVLENDLLFELRHLQNQVELVRQLHGGHPYLKVMDALGRLDAKLDAKRHGVTRFFYLISLTTIPNYTKAVTRGAVVETSRRLAITAIALRRYELKHSSLPQTLASLAPEFLRSVPRDCMDGLLLKYRVNKDGTFSLYSVGTDGKDNGGDPTPSTNGGIAKFCEGRDAVWPLSTHAIKNNVSERAAF